MSPSPQSQGFSAVQQSSLPASRPAGLFGPHGVSSHFTLQQSSRPPHSQLSVPQTRSPLQSSTTSQSPSPWSHGFSGVQQSSFPMPRSSLVGPHPEVEGVQQSSSPSSAFHEQLLFPQTRSPRQSMLVSQSPSPWSHLWCGVQQSSL